MTEEYAHLLMVIRQLIKPIYQALHEALLPLLHCCLLSCIVF